MNDMALLYQFMERFIYNLVAPHPLAPLISRQAMNFATPYIEKYVRPFLDPQTQEIDVKTAVGFGSEELINRINKYKEEHKND